jgi:2-dehydropantoate 2-reductase
MRIAIFGTGGVGGRFGAQLASAGEDVAFIARGEHLQAIQTQGLRLATPEGDIVIHPAKASDDPAQVGMVDLVILGVKSWQVRNAAMAMKPMIGPETFVLPLQNGLEAATQLSEVLGAEHVIGGLCGTFSWIDGPGRIRSIGEYHFVAFAELDNAPSTRTEELRKVFERAGINAEIPADIHAALWRKFLFVVSFGAVGSVTRAPIGVIRTVPETRRMLERCMHEIIAVARAHQISLSDDVIGRMMDSVDSLPPSATTSLQRDIADGRPSELEAFSGAVVRYGNKVGVATPLHKFIYHSLLPLELRARQQVEFP